MWINYSFDMVMSCYVAEISTEVSMLARSHASSVKSKAPPPARSPSSSLNL